MKFTQLTESVMIKHKYCFMPILNYTKINEKYIDFTSTNILEPDKIQDLLDGESNKIKFNPKRFSFDEIILYENYKKILEYPQNNENFNIDLSNIIDNACAKYITLDTFNASNQAELRKQIELLEQKISKSPNNMKDDGSHFLYRRERMIRFKMLQKNMSQKILAKRLNLTESYISKLITGERYNQDFEKYIIHILDVNYCSL